MHDGRGRMFKRILVGLAVTVAIPVIGFLVAYWIISDINAQFGAGANVVLACQVQQFSGDAELQGFCDELLNIVLLRDTSIWAGVVALGLMAVYLISSLVAGSNRWLNAFIFPKLVPISTIILAGLVLVQGAILTYAAYIGESYAIERVHFFIIGAIGLGALVGGLKLISASFSLKRELTQTEFGKRLDHNDAPSLWAFVEDIATKLNSKKPDHIVVGLEPNFYATGANVELANEDELLKGETLYLSLPIMRLFNRQELSAVIGHELGHFRGKDTAYSLKFAPVYRGLSNAIDTIYDDDGGASSLAKLPAVSMLSLMLEMFARNERKISREREFEADNAGVSVSSPDALSSALGKIAVYAPLWEQIRTQNIDRLNHGKLTINLSQTYRDSARFDISNTDIEELMMEILITRISHPTDTHPTISERLANIGADKNALTISKLTEQGESGLELLDEFLLETEKELTLFEHRLMVAMGAVTPPDEEEEEEPNYFLNATYHLAAAMVGADGMIERDEVVTAENIGTELFSEFDAVEFRSCCNDPTNIADFRDTVEILSPALTSENKAIIHNYLRQVALADGEIAGEEKELLDYMRDQWELDA